MRMGRREKDDEKAAFLPPPPRRAPAPTAPPLLEEDAEEDKDLFTAGVAPGVAARARVANARELLELMFDDCVDISD